jgi:hypothetical protein
MLIQIRTKFSLELSLKIMIEQGYLVLGVATPMSVGKSTIEKASSK